ncbi:hypothetical protein TNCV_1663781 [Trichonephila clavipes]|nr:hypothetical protein TNCV_1663781 [Trichonephila clavipes]
MISKAVAELGQQIRSWSEIYTNLQSQKTPKSISDKVRTDPSQPVNIEGNECADSLTKEGRDHGQTCTTITLTAANNVALT